MIFAKSFPQETGLDGYSAKEPGMKIQELLSGALALLETEASADIALRPNVSFTNVSRYAPIENLIHESLHHELGRRIELVEELSAFIASRNGKLEITIPWRKSSWTLEHALHAFFVYFHLVRVRAVFLESGHLSKSEKAALIDAGAEVQEIIRVLQI